MLSIDGNVIVYNFSLYHFSEFFNKKKPPTLKFKMVEVTSTGSRKSEFIDLL